MDTRYRAEQVGSLLRPPGLLDARAAHAEGRLALEELRQVEDRAIRDALEMQRQVGLDVFTDGEYRRSNWHSDMAEAVEGFVPASLALDWRGPSGTNPSLHVIGGKLRQLRRLTAHEVGVLREHSPGAFKITIPSVGTFGLMSYQSGITDQYYPTASDLLAAAVPIVRDEVSALVAEGVPYVQIDAPHYAFLVDQRLREKMPQSGWQLDRALTELVEADNACLQGVRRDDVTLALHVCRGNSRSRWLAEGGYEPVAEELFG
jgi:5-methyltetrahydropteroyltriglutamate--homocysteine methyltransferase